MEAINIIHVMKLNCFKLLVYWLTGMTFGSQWMKWHLCRMYEANCIRLAIPPITSQLPHHTLSAPHPVFSPLFPLSRESLAPLVLFSNTNLTGHPAFLFSPQFGPVCCLDKSRLMAQPSVNPLLYVVYHRQDCIILVCSHGKCLSLYIRGQHLYQAGIQTSIKMHNIVDISNNRYIGYKELVE